MADSLAHLALATLTALSWVGLGSALLRPLPRSGDAALDFLNRFGAGAAAWSLATFLIGLTGGLHAWLNEHLPGDARVLYGPAYTLYLERDAIPWTLDALPTDAPDVDVRRFFDRQRPNYAAVVSTDLTRIAQLQLVGAEPIARVRVHQVFSRTRREIGPPETLVVYRVPS